MFGILFKGTIRLYFLIDEAGKILGVWYKIKPEMMVPKAKKVLGKRN